MEIDDPQCPKGHALNRVQRLHWPRPSLLTLLFGLDYQRDYYDRRFHGDIAIEYPQGPPSVPPLTGVAYRDQGQYQILIFAETGRLVASCRRPGFPAPTTVQSGAGLLAAMAAGAPPGVLRRINAHAGAQVRVRSEAGFHYRVAISPDGILHATMEDADRRLLLTQHRRVADYDDASWLLLLDRGLVLPAERDFTPLYPGYRLFPSPGRRPAPSLLSTLFSMAYGEEYFRARLKAMPVARYQGDLSVLVFERDGRQLALAFAEDGAFVLQSDLPALPPREWTAWQVIAGAFGMANGWTLETFRRSFRNSQHYGEAEECGLTYACAVRDAALIAAFAPDGRCLGLSQRRIEQWPPDTIARLRAVRLLGD